MLPLADKPEELNATMLLDTLGDPFALHNPPPVFAVLETIVLFTMAGPCPVQYIPPPKSDWLPLMMLLQITADEFEQYIPPPISARASEADKQQNTQTATDAATAIRNIRYSLN